MSCSYFRSLKKCTCSFSLFFFFTVLAILYMLFSMDRLKVISSHVEFQNKWTSTFIIPVVPNDPYRNHTFCNFQPLLPKEALEASHLLKSIAWPETPTLPSPLSLNQTSDPTHSTFTILPGRKGGQWYIGDQLEVMIKIYDFQGHPKKSGGDLLLARLHNPKLNAGVAGQVVDHLNGSYSTVFSLLWEGSAQVEVILVHPSEAITVLRKLTIEHHDRIFFKSDFRSGKITETTTCNVCLDLTKQPVCNYTDLHTSESWFCYRPKKLSCDARINHATGGYKQKTLKTNEEKLFQGGVNMRVSLPAAGPANVTILPKIKGQAQIKSSIVKSGPSGYYYQGVWRALDGTTVQQFNTSSAISQCLKGKKLHLHGDSTIRQWFEHLTEVSPDLKTFDLHSHRKIGPHMALDYVNNVLVTYRCHGPPIRFSPVPVSELRYIANELDHIIGGPDTVIVISIWAHFSTYPIEVYIRRLQGIRSAVQRLMSRAPGTLVIIRTANPKALSLSETLLVSDWFALQRDKVLRAVFKGVKVHLVDAWEMVLAHYLPHNLHPPPPIIKNMIDVVLSYICPQKVGKLH
ncbi:NXPE family member 3-like isoform 1-T2 [Pholidichthys leucotaenia]